MTNNINDIPLSDDAIISSDRVNVGQLKQILNDLDDSTEIVIPITILGIEVDQFELGAVLLTASKSTVGLVAVMNSELASPGEDGVPFGSNDEDCGCDDDDDDEDDNKPFA